MSRQCFRRQIAVSCLFSAGLISVGMGVSYAQQTVERVEITGSNIRRIEGETKRERAMKEKDIRGLLVDVKAGRMSRRS